jgi:hypothetical protein
VDTVTYGESAYELTSALHTHLDSQAKGCKLTSGDLGAVLELFLGQGPSVEAD